MAYDMEGFEDLKKDFLTGCFTRDGLVPMLRKIGAESKAYKRPFSILLIDLDHFKPLNDKYGHVYGDEVLKYFSTSLRLNLGKTDNVPFRYGGDEFVIVFPGKNSSEAYLLAHELQRHLQGKAFLYQGHQFKMGFSGGITSFPQDAVSIEEMITRADKAMYYAKRHGHGRCMQYNRIGLERLKIFAVLILFFVVVGGALLSTHDYLKTYFMSAVNLVRGVQIKVLPEQNIDIVYLKTGGAFKGKIASENDREVELRLTLEGSEGIMVIERSKIQKIERDVKIRPEK